MRRSLAVALVLAPLLVHAPAARAYVPRGYVWPGTTIRYWVAAPEDRRSVSYAARAWNGADVGIRFSRSASADEADFVVERGSAICGVSALAGYCGPGVQTTVRIGTGCHDRRS